MINWDILLHELESGKCVLCVGPDVFSMTDEARLENKLADTLRQKQKSDNLGIHVYEDGWFHYLKERDELATWFIIKQFYERQLPSDADALFQNIAALPFHLILNFTPDYRLREAFVSSGKPFEFDCLNKTENCKKADFEPTHAKPLVFNMLGEIREKESLIMTYDDLFGYMEAIFDKKRLPKNVKDKLEQATHFIFLGMPLDKWYFHLFMRVLNMHKDTTKTKRFAATYSVNGANATLCEEQYTLTFVQEDVSAFTHLLKTKWAELQAQKAGGKVLGIYDGWRELVKTGEDVSIRHLFREMKTFTAQNNEWINQGIMLEMQWNGFSSTLFETQMSKNAMKSQIVNGMLYLIDQIEQQNPNGQP